MVRSISLVEADVLRGLRERGDDDGGLERPCDYELPRLKALLLSWSFRVPFGAAATASASRSRAAWAYLVGAVELSQLGAPGWRSSSPSSCSRNPCRPSSSSARAYGSRGPR